MLGYWRVSKGRGWEEIPSKKLHSLMQFDVIRQLNLQKIQCEGCTAVPL